MNEPKASAGERFWAKVARGAENECWEWQGTRSGNGYGRLARSRKGPEYAHRLSWEYTHGAIPKGMYVLHRCDHRPCCNPAHLFLGTHQDNMDDMARKGRATGRGLPGEQGSNARLTWSQVNSIRERFARGESKVELAREHGVTRTNVHWIVTGKSWRQNEQASAT